MLGILLYFRGMTSYLGWDQIFYKHYENKWWVAISFSSPEPQTGWNGVFRFENKYSDENLICFLCIIQVSNLNISSHLCFSICYVKHFCSLYSVQMSWKQSCSLSNGFSTWTGSEFNAHNFKFASRLVPFSVEHELKPTDNSNTFLALLLLEKENMSKKK